MQRSAPVGQMLRFLCVLTVLRHGQAEIKPGLRGLAACKTLAKQAGEKRSMQTSAAVVNADAQVFRA